MSWQACKVEFLAGTDRELFQVEPHRPAIAIPKGVDRVQLANMVSGFLGEGRGIQPGQVPIGRQLVELLGQRTLV